MSFEEADKHIGVGGGTVIISIDGSRFIAETETDKGLKSVIYSGSEQGG
ncbi:hypothetical protein [Thiorhodovibrio frisius]|uniref:Uncharacterized protein n=1 Tax=Thiorhodovibrio frisius TaxID=631362 RepID=H8Z8K6_9GAMM|nr:hypothetical protein [Thiorhodovibrio frisius]EIC19411.1 hypothetical protein Thi970DRAFT_04930 [Thiorhodovibrio frisius]WPL22287.1 hypothetical protein Thiofri_02447 [Thiorhodovibrio frisius]